MSANHRNILDAALASGGATIIFDTPEDAHSCRMNLYRFRIRERRKGNVVYDELTITIKDDTMRIYVGLQHNITLTLGAPA